MPTPIPRPVIVIDLAIDTSLAVRRSRFYFEATVQPTGLTQLEAICNGVMATYPPLMVPNMTTQVKILRAEGRYYGGGTTGFEANSTVGAVQGTIAAATPGSDSEDEASILPDTLPDEVSVVVQKRTGNTGKGAYGRWFFTGFSERIQNHGYISKDHKAALKTFADKLSDNITVSTGFSTVLNPRHWDRKTNTLRPITKCYLLATVGTRLDRRRPLAMERA